jgi:hypothetical protein
VPAEPPGVTIEDDSDALIGGALDGVAGMRRRLLDRLDTTGLQRFDGTPTKALVVFNPRADNVTFGVAVFHARFPVRTETGARPITVRDDQGRVIPSRVVDETLSAADTPGGGNRVIWSFDLQLLVCDIPARGFRTFAASYGYDRASEAEPEAWERAQAGGPFLEVGETDCHAGDLPPVFSLRGASGRAGKHGTV